jgi:hypothetical protein
MKLLPAVTEPWAEKIERLHAPKPATREDGYEEYRSCLRWEFDFSCAFCMCNEADLRGRPDTGTEGTATFWIEHFFPKKHAPLLANAYSNCFYACRYCNRARGRKLNIDSTGRQLLNPCDVLWADYFVRDGDRLQPRNDDPDARYTHEAYKLDLPRKVRARTLRRKKILDYEQAKSDDYQDLIAELRREGLRRGNPKLIRAAAVLWEKRRDTMRDVLEFLMVPEDATRPCFCKREPPASPRVQ